MKLDHKSFWEFWKEESIILMIGRKLKWFFTGGYMRIRMMDILMIGLGIYLFFGNPVVIALSLIGGLIFGDVFFLIVGWRKRNG